MASPDETTDVAQLVEELKTDITNDVEISLEKQKTEIQAALDKKLKKLTDILTKKGSGLVTCVGNIEKQLNKQSTILNKRFKSVEESISANEANLVELHTILDRSGAAEENGLATKVRKLEADRSSLLDRVELLEKNHPTVVLSDNVVTCSKEEVQDMHIQLQSKLRDQMCTIQQFRALESKVEAHSAATVSTLSRVYSGIDKLETKVSTNEVKINVNLAKIMHNNIKIGSLLEKDDEDPLVVVTTFFTNVMKIKPGKGDVLEVSRMKGTLR